MWKMEDLEEEVGFGVGVISRSAVCGPPHLPGQSGVDFVLIMPHRQLIILCHTTQHMQNLHSSMQPICPWILQHVAQLYGHNLPVTPGGKGPQTKCRTDRWLGLGWLVGQGVVVGCERGIWRR